MVHSLSYFNPIYILTVRFLNTYFNNAYYFSLFVAGFVYLLFGFFFVLNFLTCLTPSAGAMSAMTLPVSRRTPYVGEI